MRAIQVEKLSKQYRIGARRQRYRTLRESIADALAAPMRRARSLLRGSRAARETRGGTVWALRDISFEVRQGEVAGIIGRNGAGKSTLLKILSRITEPTSGGALIRGRVGSLLEVGTGFHPELTGRENVYLNGAILGMKRAEIDRRFDEIVGFSEVETFIDTPVKHYSSGMYLRLAFAVAAHLRPDILLVDEVLAVGDLAFQRKCIGKMQDVAQDGRTVLFVSHSLPSIQSLCGRVLLLDSGTLAADGAPQEIIPRYLAMNRGAASLELDRGKNGRRGGGRFRFARCELLNGRGEPADIFLPGEEIVLRLTADVFAPLDGPVLGVDLQNTQGLVVSNLRSEESRLLPGLEPGRHRFEVRFRLERFLRNVYTLHVGATSRGCEVLDLVRDAARITIAATNHSGFGRTRQAGEVVYVPSEWSVLA